MKHIGKLPILSVFLISIIIALYTFIPPNVAVADGEEWPQFQKDEMNSGITSEQGPISDISVEWKQHVASDGHAGMCVAPLVAEGKVFVYDAFSVFWAFDAKTGAELWSTELSFEGMAFQLATPAYNGGRLYVASNDGHVYALNAQDGGIIWNTQVCDIFEQLNTPVTYYNGKVYVGRWSQDNEKRDPTFYCLDANSGAVVWDRVSTSGGGYYWSGGCIIGNYFVYGDGKDYLVAVNKDTGDTVDELCIEDLPYAPPTADKPRLIRGTVNWQEAGSGYGYLYFTDFLGAFGDPEGGFFWKVGFDSSTGQFDRTPGSGWSINIGYSTSTPAVYNGRIYIGTGNFASTPESPDNPGYLICFDEQGNEIWRFLTAGGVESSPVLTPRDGKVYIYFNANCENGTTYCLDENGNEIWHFTNDEQGTNYSYTLQGVAIYDGWLYFGNDGGNVYGITTGSSSPTDSTAPTIADITPSSGATIEDVWAVVSATYSDDESGIDTIRMKMVIDDMDVTSSAIITDTYISYTPEHPWQDGIRNIQLTVYDNAGNKAYRAWNFIVAAPPGVDNTPPTIANPKPTLGTTVETGTPVVSAIYSDAESGIDTTSIIMQIDGVAVTAVVTPTQISYVPAQPLSNGDRYVQLWVSDTADNQAYCTWMFRVEESSSSPEDDIPPVIANLTPASAATVNTGTPTISADYSDADSEIDISSIILKVDGVSVAAAITATHVSYTPTESLTDGEHHIELRVSDTEGNQNIRDWTFRVEIPAAELFDWITDTSGRNPEKIEVTSADNQVELRIPEGTLATFLQSSPPSINILQSTQSPAASGDFHIIGKVYEIGPDGTVFDSPVTLTINYIEISLPSWGMAWDINADGTINYLDISLKGGAASYNVNEEYFKIGWFDDSVNDWVILENSILDTEKNTISIEVDHLSKYTILSSVSESLPAAFTIENIMINPETAAPDENVSITALIVNTGEVAGNYDLSLKINGIIEAVEGMILAPGEKRGVVFTTSKNVTGTYSVEVGEQTASFTVTQSTPGNVAESDNEIATTAPFRERDAITADLISTDWLLSCGIAGAIVIAGAIAIFILLRRRRDVK